MPESIVVPVGARGIARSFVSIDVAVVLHDTRSVSIARNTRNENAIFLNIVALKPPVKRAGMRTVQDGKPKMLSVVRFAAAN